MKIHNTVDYFLANYSPSIQFLTQYHERYQENFKEYFLYHCRNPHEKSKNAIYSYPSKMNDIKESNEKIEKIISQIALTYEEKYHVLFTQDVHIIVGIYGSNAFTHRQIIPEITFCLEKLSSNEEHLKVIIAHEFGHALHNILSDKEGTDWTKIQWFHPYTTLFQEGCATYFSEQVVNATKSTYFSYDDNGNDWLRFAEENKSEIINAFMEDVKIHTQAEVYHEWFSINGGSYYGFSRLAYFIGYNVIQYLIEKYKETKAVTLWKESTFFDEIEHALLSLQSE